MTEINFCNFKMFEVQKMSPFSTKVLMCIGKLDEIPLIIIINERASCLACVHTIMTVNTATNAIFIYRGVRSTVKGSYELN